MSEYKLEGRENFILKGEKIQEYNLKDLEYKPVINVAELEEGKFYAIKLHTDEEYALGNCKQLVDMLKEHNINCCIIPDYNKDVEIQEVETIETEYKPEGVEVREDE